MRLFTKLLALPVLMGLHTHAQTTVTQWDFNSNPPDASNSTGSTSPSTGAGAISAIGGVSVSFGSGTSNGGSSDPAAADNTGWAVTGFPSVSTGDKTAGIQFNASTASYQNIIVTFDLRHSNTSSRYEQFQYTLDASVASPIWVDFGVGDGNAGDTWFNNRTYNLSAVTGLNNNANAAFRVVSTFNGGSGYSASSSGSTYAGSGTWRFDMVTVTGTSTSGVDNIPPVAQNYFITSNTTSFIKFSEPLSSATATNVANYTFYSSLAVNSATLSTTGDTVFLTHAAVTDGQPDTLTVSNVQDPAGNIMTSTPFNVLFNASLPDLVITEIAHSPNTMEFIEVYNAGTAAVNLGGLKWANGTTGDFPVMSLAPGTTALFSTDPVNAAAILNVSPIYTINNGLGSSNDILVIKNSLGQNVDSVEYFVGTNGWPAAPTGQYGYSFELISPTADNALGSNWTAPQNPVTPQPSQGVVTATPGVYPAPPYVPTSANISFTAGNKISIPETTATVDIIATLNGNNPSAVTVDLEVIPMSTASPGSDYTLPATMQFSWPANSNGVNDTITITINNDAIAEPAEYFIMRFTNPVNTTLPPAVSNHFTVFISDDDKQAPAATGQLTLTHLSSFSNGTAGNNSAEIVAYDSASRRLFIANSIGAKIDIVDFHNPLSPSLITSVSVNPAYGNINSVAVKNGIVAAAIEDLIPQQNGKVVFFDTNGVYINQVNVGAMPDMITFNHAGTKVFTANEGEPNGTYAVDPEGSVSIIDISGGVASLTQSNVATVDFTSFNPQVATLKAQGIRIFGPNATVAQDMEPEYITISDDDQTAWVTCQENNAIATVDLTTNTVTQLLPLGLKDYMTGTNAMDASDQGSEVQIAQWPVKGVYMPDAVAQYSVNGQTYLVTANEGDAREYNGYEETGRLGDASYVLDSAAFPYREALKANIGRLNITTASGDTDGDGDYDEIHVYGGRSFSIWNAATGALVWDSGDELEEITSRHPVYGVIFNAHNENNTFKNRSDDKGPEPEGVTVAQIGSNIYAFVALERIGGCMVYNITYPSSPAYVTYVNTRTIASYGGDNGAEGIIYIDSASSPNGLPVVILANEISSTLSIFQVADNVPLNISLNGIAAYNRGGINEVAWNTVTEEKTDVFEIQRSKDAVSFIAIGSVKANGVASNYIFKDENPFSGINYYRILLKNTNGKYQYSSIVSAVVGDETNNSTVTVYPNPAKDVLYVMNHLPNATLEIYDLQGILAVKQDLKNDLNIIPVQNLPMGNYIIRYGNAQETKHVKFIKN